MDHEAFDQEAIGRYLKDLMDQEEKFLFEQQMAQQPGLAAEVVLQRDIQQGIRAHGYTSLKELLKNADRNSPPAEDSPPESGHRLYTWMLVAASLAAVLLLGYLLLPNQPGHQTLVASYYQPYPNILSPADRSPLEAEDSLKQALYAYESGNYRQAIALFEQNEGQWHEGHRFYLALSYYEAGQPARTVDLLHKVIKKKESLFYEPALWYQALAYIRIARVQPARENLKTLAKDNNSYRQKATDLLESIH